MNLGSGCGLYATMALYQAYCQGGAITYTRLRGYNWTCTISVLEMSNELIYTESTLSRYICTDQTKDVNKYKQIGADYSVKTPGFST